MSSELSFENGIPSTWTTIENGIIDDINHFDGLEKLTFIVCLRHAFQIGGQAYPSQTTIAKKVGCTDRTIRTHLVNLEKKGFLKKVGVNKETQTVIWKTLIPENLRIEWTEKELDRLKQKAEPVQEIKTMKKQKETIPYKEIVDHLNQKADRSYKHTANATKEKIRARWNEGQRLEDFKRVIDNMTSNWKGDPKMDQYLRPETLFGAKFDSYLNTKPKAKAPKHFQEDQAFQVNKELKTAMTEERRLELLKDAGII